MGEVHSVLQVVLDRGSLMVVMVILRKVMIAMFSTSVLVSLTTVWALVQRLEVLVVQPLASVPTLMSSINHVLANDVCTLLMRSLKPVLERVLVVMGWAFVEPVLVIVAMLWGTMVIIAILVSDILHITIAKVLRVVDELSMSSLYVHPWVVLKLGLVVNRTNIVSLLIVGMVVHRIMLVVVIEPVLENGVFLTNTNFVLRIL